MAGVCNDCGTALVQRADDSAETVKARLVVYHKDTERMIPYYRDQRNFVRIEGNGEVKGVLGPLKKPVKRPIRKKQLIRKKWLINESVGK